MSHARPPTPPFGRTVTLKPGLRAALPRAGSGPPVVFVHGSGPGVNAYSNFFPNYREIAAAGYRALLPDMVGFGWSSKPSGLDYTLDLFTSTLRRVPRSDGDPALRAGGQLPRWRHLDEVAIDHPRARRAAGGDGTWRP